MSQDLLQESEQQVSPVIFRAYDIRGIVDETLTLDGIYQIGLAIGSETRSRGITHIISGRDGRNSSPILSLALQKGILATGCHVIDIGDVPTPVLYYATHVLTTNSGVMLTGSHNPAEYNGLKIVIDGKTLAKEEIQKLYQRIKNEDFIYGHGEIEAAEVLPTYVNRIKDEIKLSRQLKVVVDCGNGIAGIIAPHLLQQLGCEVIELFCDIDGDFPNHEPDPSQPKNLINLISVVKQTKADLGLAFDGDGDRIGVVTNNGEIIWPDRLMMLFAKQLLQKQPQAKIIFDVKCSRHLANVIQQNGGEAIMSQTGHSLIKAKMLAENAALAGEMSGHIFFKDRWYGFDDGIYTAARLLEILAQDSRLIVDIFNELPNSINTPEIKLPIPEARKNILMEKFIAHANFGNAEINTIDGIRVDFNEGWGLLRPSNTTAHLTLRFEADSEHALEHIKSLFRKQLLELDMGLSLTF
jgi:phosphomannomutase/phosphoglucomutase